MRNYWSLYKRLAIKIATQRRRHVTRIKFALQEEDIVTQIINSWKIMRFTIPQYVYKKFFSRFLTHELHLNVISWWKVTVMPRVRKRNSYQHVIEFDRGRIRAYRDCGLSYGIIVTFVCRDPLTEFRIWSQWVQKSHRECLAEFQWTVIINSREDSYLTLMALLDRTSTSRILSQEMGSFAR